ncbi:bacterial Ig-like domain-containing protein, partial [Acholeplasma laidlawii]|uniref:bacterial Ig-like domain-containing protein n=1 Tax=Acholeplasma laidlawii TaxID=2148 RepID=UPI0018C33133
MNINIRKIGALLLLLFSIFTLAACQNITEEVTVESIQVEISTLKPNYNVDDFDLSTISIRVTFSDGKFQIIPITESMLTEEHLSLLSNVGEHQITITYQGKSTTINLNLQYDSLKTQLMTLYTLSTTSGSFSGTYEEWLETVRGPQGNPGREVLFQVSGGYIQWQYTGDSSWTNLVELTSLVGPAGQDGVDGINGKQVTFQVSEGFIQWQYAGDLTWNNLIDLATITGANGTNGTDGVDGKEVLFQVADG